MNVFNIEYDTFCTGSRQDTETILRNDETDIPDNGDPELNELVESRDESDSHQTMRTRTEINNDTTDASVNVLYERHASGQQDQESSRHIGIILSATISPGTTSSGRRIPKSKSLPQGLGSAASSEKYLPRTTHSFHEDVQVSKIVYVKSRYIRVKGKK